MTPPKDNIDEIDDLFWRWGHNPHWEKTEILETVHQLIRDKVVEARNNLLEDIKEFTINNELKERFSIVLYNYLCELKTGGEENIADDTN